MRFIEFNKGWKVFGVIMLTIIVAVGIFCLTVEIMAHCNSLTFVEQFNQIFGIVSSKPAEEGNVIEECINGLMLR